MNSKLMATLAAVSLLLLLTGTVICSPVEMLSSEEPDTEQPSRCRLAKPRTPSTSDCPNSKQRRFIYQESNAKGCKPFGICESDLEAYDAKYAGGDENYFLDFDSCQRECMMHVQCPMLNLSETSNVHVSSTNGLLGWGERIFYDCNDGYSFAPDSTHHSRICQKDGTWTGEEPICLKQCQSPDVIPNGNYAPAKGLYNYGGNVHYTCNVGYNLVGDAMRTCGVNGQWMGPEPTCTCAFPLDDGTCPPLCPEPKLIDNGVINAPEGARGHGGISHYSCVEGFTLIGNSSRTCNNGNWLGEEPTCWKVAIIMTMNGRKSDVTNSSVSVVKGSTNIVFEVIPTPGDLFEEDEIKWDFMGKNQRTDMPFGLMEEKLKITFNIILNTKEQEGNYTIFFGDYSTSFMLEVEDGTVASTTYPYFVTVPSPDITVSSGSTKSLLCISKGKPVPSIQWYHNKANTPLEEGTKYTFSGFVSGDVRVSALQISNIEVSDIGDYICNATNAAGSNTTLVSRLIFGSRKKRSVEQLPHQVDSLCHQSSPDSVTILGRVKKTITSGQTQMYRVHVQHIFSSTSSRSSQILHKTKTLSTFVWSSNLMDQNDERLQRNREYVFQGQILDGQILLASAGRIQRYTPAVRQRLMAC